MAKDGNGKINNTQRRILSNLAVEVLDKKVQHARDESGNLVNHKVRIAINFTLCL